MIRLPGSTALRLFFGSNSRPAQLRRNTFLGGVFNAVHPRASFLCLVPTIISKPFDDLIVAVPSSSSVLLTSPRSPLMHPLDTTTHLSIHGEHVQLPQCQRSTSTCRPNQVNAKFLQFRQRLTLLCLVGGYSRHQRRMQCMIR